MGDVFDERTTGSLARGENQCSSASDDSIQSAVNEVLKITSNEDNVLLTSITLNANHDGNLKDGDKVKVDGVEYDVTGLLTTIGTKTYFTLTLNKMLGIGDMVTVESVNRPHLYMSSMEAATVPIPAAGLLLLGGLAGLGAVRKLRKPV